MSNNPVGMSGEKSQAPRNKTILDDRRVRLVLAIALAILSWMAVTIVVQPGTTTTLRGVPVDFAYDSMTYTSKGLSIVNAPAKTVDLNLSGDGYTIGSLTQSDFVVYPDWSSVRSSGEKTLSLRVRCIASTADSVTVTIAGSDNTVDVVFDVVEEKTLPVQVTTNYLTIADGYILYDTNVSAETVTLSGPSSELSQVATCTAEVTYSEELHSTQTLSTNLRFYTKSGSEVKFDYVTMDRESVEVTLLVYKRATLPLNITFINEPSNFDESVLVYSLSRDHLEVAGPEEAVDTLRDLSVGIIDLSTFALDKVYTMELRLPNGIVSLENIPTVTISFDCSRLETKTMNLPASCVQVINLPSTYQLTVETERLMNVVLCGPKGSLESLTPEQVVIEIDAEDFSVSLGQQNIACSLYVPSNAKIFALGTYAVQCRIESN